MNDERFSVITDCEYSATHKTDRITVWSGTFASTFKAEGVSRPRNAARSGYTLTTYNGDRVSVDCPTPRNEANYQAVDRLVSRALNAHYRLIGATKLVNA